MYSLVLLLPLLSFLSTNCLGRFIGIFGSCLLATASIFLSFSFSVFSFYEVALSDSTVLVNLASWLNIELFDAGWSFFFDTIAVVMLLVVTGVSSLVHLYSTEYMSGDPHLGRFMGYLSLFTFFMLVLVTADNFLVMFFGWEGIGLASYLLISFWYNRIQAGKSAVKAMLVNRVGDVGLALGISIIFIEFKSIDYAVVFGLVPLAANNCYSFLLFNIDKLTIISFLLFWGALGKSAQLGLHIWLPDAMEGPTPVSALIHAATLVTAGVFLVIRSSSLFENSQTMLVIVSIFGSLTAFFAASVGLVQNDLKRVIAYSTCSQLGYMVFACGLSHYSVALFHLANHALFKALLFLSAGCIIHGISDEQDLRKMGGLVKFLPLSYVMILIGSLALVGWPFLTGFYSKDAILEIALVVPTQVGNFSHWLGCIAAFFTSFYSFRLVFLSFINETNTYKSYLNNTHDAPIKMAIPLLVLALGSIFWGFLSRDMVIGLGTPFFGSSIFNFRESLYIIDSEFSSALLKNIPLYFTLLGALLSFLLIHCSLASKDVIYAYKTSTIYMFIYTFLVKKWNFDQVANDFISVRSLNFGYSTSFKIADKGSIEVLGPLGIASQILNFSKTTVLIQSGLVFHYASFMLFFMLFFVSFVILSDWLLAVFALTFLYFLISFTNS